MPRLYHTKSRTGCARCRARRVKCDESRPKCKSCGRHGVECIYDRPAGSNGSSSSKAHHYAQFWPSSTPSTGQNARGPNAENFDLLAEESRDRRYREMRLLHYFTVEVTTTIPGYFFPQIKKIWTVDVPSMAMEYEPLLNAIMALSILHLSYMDNTRGILKPEQLEWQGAQYLEATLQQHRNAIGSLEREIADPASFTSVILSLHALASLRERTFEPYHPPIQWLQMCKGVMNVFKVTIPFVRDDPTAKINVVTESSAPFVEPSVLFCEANRNRFPYLLISQPGDDDAEDQEAYSSTACLIGALLAAQETPEHAATTWRKVVISPILFPRRFLDLLNLRRPRALVILAHFFGAAARFSDVWWVGDSPRREVLAIEEYLGPDWQYQMTWPIKAIRKSASPCGLVASTQ
ncbi:Zn(2)-Cys(6) zinc finger domain protein [Metarhizium robertsii]|uniref:Zn(2)-C6 fungal-type DNA-binding domain protein n=2 Tax=Metarhizium robertsii TaxID=568076 RepID=E9EQG9_METRA|nr:Zn(2)-C6 fungal-type DNA-binding domain protein [Metarhizium robertsii ARSEF 23]EFZ02370.1 Zn(2)-C6 fungal-type DNA-binding domain protein [Metarhizium robertsii ARSEF 23]EXV05556.1 Zn(2)-Cys(6) zinc finger domain protein [Metarhizium robertsii]